jgi:hypothetical protein
MKKFKDLKFTNNNKLTVINIISLDDNSYTQGGYTERVI